ncbi:hydroxymethylglutaryl-CoA lyase [Loktanella sp. F6476L]|uniref:hydroxymethylglutaryl-CoA lyase n=1 Tax=Loktanella sp. F6476L TaxID=2926405 RepID=UPI001FF503E8|nr:hydroxymethylglutaryl-CoA lyase [Loktanella sp. F6476L]MCK0120882.1 hydroxymethylglutaryl-CoA lyase [Loktanella sp. F6476L]
MAEHVTIHEVGPRDGLQNEPGVISVADKVALIDLLGTAGLTDIEVGSFVSPKWVPQMANTPDVLTKMTRMAGCTYGVLVPNMRGWESFAPFASGPFEVAVFISASEGFSQSNLNCSVAESIVRLTPVVRAAEAVGVPVRGYVSCITDCPFDGPTQPEAVAKAVADLRAVAPMQVSLGDTLGRGEPARVATMLDAVLNIAPADQLAGHFHDTGGQALENVGVALGKGLRHFDSAVGGLGGCPYAPGAPGNVATEAVLAHVTTLGYTTGVDGDVIAQAAALARSMKG